MDHRQKVDAELSASAHRRSGLSGESTFKGRWEITCRDKFGNVKWVDVIENLVTNAGLNHLLDVALSGGTQVTTWFVGLTAGSPTAAAADTMASHAGWTEVTAYDEATRVTWVDGGASGQSISNTASPAAFTISANGTTIGGAFLVSNATKGGTTGTLYAVGAFATGNKTLDDNDTIDVTASFTAAAA